MEVVTFSSEKMNGADAARGMCNDAPRVRSDRRERSIAGEVAEALRRDRSVMQDTMRTVAA
jgi:hypothetical protein